jgi:hypothetical protein
MGRLVHTGLGSSSLVAHVLHYPPPPTRTAFCNRSSLITPFFARAKRWKGVCAIPAARTPESAPTPFFARAKPQRWKGVCTTPSGCIGLKKKRGVRGTYVCFMIPIHVAGVAYGTWGQSRTKLRLRVRRCRWKRRSLDRCALIGKLLCGRRRTRIL